MDCNKDEAQRAKSMAEKKMASNDFEAAQKMALKARNLFPELENISQILSVCDVHCSAKKTMMGSVKDWYGILQVERFANDIIVKKQYKRLALVLHPDKNQHPGAEAAFKLICEANAVLSDPIKKSEYDSKLRMTVRYAPVNPPPHHMPMNSQLNRPFEASKSYSYGFRPMNHYHASPAGTNIRMETFWTLCPYCGLKYQYDRRFLLAKLLCQKCSKNFTAYEIDPPAGAPQMPQNPGVSHEKPYQCATKNNVNLRKQAPRRGNVSSVNLSKSGTRVSVDLKSNVEATDTVSTSHGGKRMGKNDANRKKKDSKTTSRKKAKSDVADSESSMSVESSSDSDVEVVDAAIAQDSGTSRVYHPRRSYRKRKTISYNEGDNDDDDNDDTDDDEENDIPTAEGYQENKISEDEIVEMEDAPTSKDIEHDIQDGFPVEEVANHVDTSTNQEQDSNKNFPPAPDPEFYDFDKDRDEKSFAVEDYWACYDPEGMPRFYAKVDNVCESPFEISYTWLEAHPKNKYQREWVDCELPVGCGAFKLGDLDTTSTLSTFSHRVHVFKGREKNSLVLNPRIGEVWALFRDWSLNWTADPQNHRDHKYEIVEILGQDRDAGIRVTYLYKVEGFVSLFQKSSQSEDDSFLIRPKDFYRFSHRVPHHIITVTERGAPEGALELDPAALPMNPNDISYPGNHVMGGKTTELEAGRKRKKRDSTFMYVSEDNIIELND